MEPRLRIMTLRLMEKLADDPASAQRLGIRGESGTGASQADPAAAGMTLYAGLAHEIGEGRQHDGSKSG